MLLEYISGKECDGNLASVTNPTWRAGRPVAGGWSGLRLQRLESIFAINRSAGSGMGFICTAGLRMAFRTRKSGCAHEWCFMAYAGHAHLQQTGPTSAPCRLFAFPERQALIDVRLHRRSRR